jgi:Nuclease A inhibitor-like protein
MSEHAVDPELGYITGVAHRYALSLSVLVADQTLTRESDVPFSPFTAAFPVGQRLTVKAFREALGFDPSRRVDMSLAATFFDRVAVSAEEAGDKTAAQVFALLEAVMRRTLSQLTQVFVRGEGIVEVPLFLFGRLSGGPLVGLQSIAIET